MESEKDLLTLVMQCDFSIKANTELRSERMKCDGCEHACGYCPEGEYDIKTTKPSEPDSPPCSDTHQYFSGNEGELLLQKIQQIDALSTGDDIRDILCDIFYRLQDMERETALFRRSLRERLVPANTLVDTIEQNASEGLLLRVGGSIHTCSCSVACEKILDTIDIYLGR